MTLKGDAKFEGTLTHGLKNDKTNLVNFYASSWKSENLHFDGLLLYKAYQTLDENSQKIYVSWHWGVVQSLKNNLLFAPKMTWGIWWVLMQAVASLKICTLICYFCWKYIAFELKKYRAVMCHWRMMQNFRRNWLLLWKMTWEISRIFTQHSKVSKLLL